LDLNNSTVGSVLVVKGSSGFASQTIPGAGTIEIDGTAASGFLGYTTIGIGQFFPAPAGPGLLTAAPNVSAIYAFAGQSPSGALTVAAAEDSVVGPAADFYGFNLGLLGAIGGSPAAVSVGAPVASPPYVDVHLGTGATGPLLGVAGGAPAASVRLEDAAGGNSFGIVNLGSGVKGTSQGLSLVGGDTQPDLVVAQQSEVGLPVYIMNGALLPSLTGTVDVSSAQLQAGPVPAVVKVTGLVPSGWRGYGGSGLIVDSNGDGFPDFALGEFATGQVGRVIVFY
jgi:hypothetical protein